MSSAGKGLLWSGMVILVATLLGMYLPHRWRADPAPEMTPADTAPHEQMAARRRLTPSLAPARVPPSFSTTIERVGPKAFLVSGDVEPPPGKAVEVIAALEGQASRGDSDAALLIALKLMGCYDALARSDDDATLLVEAQAIGTLESALRRRAELSAECEGLTRSDYERRGEWLQRAADAGNVVAQLTYAASSDTVLKSPTLMLKDPQATIDFKQRAIGYLLSAASNGSIDALDQLGQSYRTGVLVTRDDTLAYAYYLAGQKADGRIKPWDMEQLESSISPRQRQDATALAREIYRGCCEGP